MRGQERYGIRIEDFAQAMGSQAWLTDVLSRIDGYKINRIEEFLPWRHTQSS